MATKLVIGLTDVENEFFLPNVRLQNYIFDNTDIIKTDTYTLFGNLSSIEKASIEWILNTDLPAVNNMLSSLDIIKSKLHITGIKTTHFTPPLPDLKNLIIYIEVANLIPNDSLVLQNYTMTDYENIYTGPQQFGSLELDSSASYTYNGTDSLETIYHAMEINSLTLLGDGPKERVVYPAFSISFYLDSTIKPINVPPNTSMSAEQVNWMNMHKAELESKGYYINDVKNKIGGLQIGSLVGSVEDAFSKIQQYTKVCRFEIIEE
jgi:hypothetical protein